MECSEYWVQSRRRPPCRSGLAQDGPLRAVELIRIIRSTGCASSRAQGTVPPATTMRPPVERTEPLSLSNYSVKSLDETTHNLWPMTQVAFLSVEGWLLPPPRITNQLSPRLHLSTLYPGPWKTSLNSRFQRYRRPSPKAHDTGQPMRSYLPYDLSSLTPDHTNFFCCITSLYVRIKRLRGELGLTASMPKHAQRQSYGSYNGRLAHLFAFMKDTGMFQRL